MSIDPSRNYLLLSSLYTFTEVKGHVVFALVAFILSIGLGGSVSVAELMELCSVVLLIVLHNPDD